MAGGRTHLGCLWGISSHPLALWVGLWWVPVVISSLPLAPWVGLWWAGISRKQREQHLLPPSFSLFPFVFFLC